MILKEGVVTNGIRQELLLALIVANDVYSQHGKDLVVTSLNDGKHSLTSLHYSGCAADLRTHYFEDAEDVKDVAASIKNRLGIDYDVVVEKDHIHMEYQPRMG